MVTRENLRLILDDAEMDETMVSSINGNGNGRCNFQGSSEAANNEYTKIRDVVRKLVLVGVIVIFVVGFIA